MSRAGWRARAMSAYWLVLAVLTAAVALVVTFSEFMPYDDEGYLLMFAAKLVRGGRLYDEVFGQYGPAYALWKVLLHGLLRVPLSHTGVRLETAALAVAILASLAAGVHRLTRSAWAAVLALYLCQRHVFLMSDHEPGHPQLLCLLLVLGALWFAGAAARRPTTGWPAAATGLLLALLALTKLNAGVFLTLTVVAWLALPWARGRVATTALLCAFCAALQLALFAGDGELWRAWGWKYFLVSSLSLTGVVAAAGASGERGVRSWPWQCAVPGAAGGAVLIALLTVARGTTAAALVDGAVLQPLRLGTRFSVRPPLGAVTLGLATAGAVAAIAWALGGLRLGWSERAGPAILGSARLAFGSFVVWRGLSAYGAFVALEGAAGLWLLAAAPPTQDPDPDADIRALVALAAAWQIPYAFPVAGTQSGYVAALVCACGVVCLHDGLRWLGDTVTVRRRMAAVPPARTALAGLVLAGVLAAESSMAAARWRDYGARIPLELRGADGIRLRPDQVAPLRELTAEISSAGCRRLISFPGMFSFNFWAGADSPTAVNVTAWMILPARDQLRLLSDVEHAESACILRNRRLEAAWSRRNVEADPIARWLAVRPVWTVARVGDYELSTMSSRLSPGPGRADQPR